MRFNYRRNWQHFHIHLGVFLVREYLLFWDCFVLMDPVHSPASLCVQVPEESSTPERVGETKTSVAMEASRLWHLGMFQAPLSPVLPWKPRENGFLKENRGHTTSKHPQVPWRTARGQCRIWTPSCPTQNWLWVPFLPTGGLQGGGVESDRQDVLQYQAPGREP